MVLVRDGPLKYEGFIVMVFVGGLRNIMVFVRDPQSIMVYRGTPKIYFKYIGFGEVPPNLHQVMVLLVTVWFS